MKNIIKHIAYSISFLLLMFFISCEKSDSQKAWGVSNIYMPQASIKDGGLTHNYPVPLNTVSNNYVYDSVKHTIGIVLGVYRSGLEDLKNYSVKVAVDIDTTNRIISGGSISNSILLPADVYSLPTDVSVPDGQREALFYLTIDRTKLNQAYSSYATKKLVLTVGISNPSRYVLNSSLCKTVIIIDAKTFMP